MESHGMPQSLPSMPIYEYYCPDNNTLYQFFAKTLAQGQTVPACPANPAFRMEKVVSKFAIAKGGRREGPDAEGGAEAEAGQIPSPEDARMEAAMGEMEREFSAVDENDPKAMGRMMRRMAELTGEKIDGEMEEVVRKLEEGVDPESLDEQLGGSSDSGDSQDDPYGDGGGGFGGMPGNGDSAGGAEPKEAKFRYKKRKPAPVRDPNLYDY